MIITVRNRDFIEDYRNFQSPNTRALIQELTAELVRFFKGLYGDSFEGIVIISLFEGSVGVNFELSLEPSSNVTNTTVVEELKRVNGTQALGFLGFLRNIRSRTYPADYTNDGNDITRSTRYMFSMSPLYNILTEGLCESPYTRLV